MTGCSRVAYFGSKATTGLCQPLIAMMPPHDTYIETHLGGGAIMKRKPAALHNIGIDLDGRALATFECDYPRTTHSRLRAPVSVRVRLSGLGADLQRPTLPDAHPHLGASLSLRVRGGRSRRATGTAQDAALPGHAVRLSLGVVRRVARRLAQPGGAGHEPGRGAHREAVVQLRPRTGCIGPAARAATSPTARPSSARRRVGASATRRCPGRNVWRCWRR